MGTAKEENRFPELNTGSLRDEIHREGKVTLRSYKVDIDATA